MIRIKNAGVRRAERAATMAMLAWCVPHSGRILSVMRCPWNNSGRCLSAQQWGSRGWGLSVARALPEGEATVEQHNAAACSCCSPAARTCDVWGCVDVHRKKVLLLDGPATPGAAAAAAIAAIAAAVGRQLQLPLPRGDVPATGGCQLLWAAARQGRQLPLPLLPLLTRQQLQGRRAGRWGWRCAGGRTQLLSGQHVLGCRQAGNRAGAGGQGAGSECLVERTLQQSREQAGRQPGS